MIEKMLINHVMKKGRSTTEFGSLVVGGAFTALVASGIIDLSPDQIELATTNVVEGAGIVQQVATGSGGIMDGVIRLVALVVGGQMVSAYIKSRGNTKSAQAMVAVKAALGELEEFKNREKKGDIDNEKEPLV